jgi:hypothetical protein
MDPKGTSHQRRSRDPNTKAPRPWGERPRGSTQRRQRPASPTGISRYPLVAGNGATRSALLNPRDTHYLATSVRAPAPGGSSPSPWPEGLPIHDPSSLRPASQVLVPVNALLYLDCRCPMASEPLSRPLEATPRLAQRHQPWQTRWAVQDLNLCPHACQACALAI